MNRENLLKMAEYIATIPQEKFSMETYMDDENCGSYGCIIGHCALLDPTFEDTGMNSYGKWSLSFTGIDSDSAEWEYLFSDRWYNTDNTPIGASNRIRHFLDHGLPEYCYEEIDGESMLSYSKT